MPPSAKPRPLSPHLQIYKPQLTSVLSIMHRLSGVALTLGMMIFVGWVVALANGPDAYATYVGYLQTDIGRIVMIGISAAFFYHLSCGIRHLFWDAGVGLDIAQVYQSGRAALVTTVVLTLTLWYFVLYGVSP